MPNACMAVPLDIEAIPGDPVQPHEGAIELLIHRLGEAGTVALDEAISCAMPFAVNVDGIVEFGSADDGQKSRLEDFVDKPLTGDGDGRLFYL